MAIDRHRLDDYTPYIYRTHDGGTTWSVDRIRAFPTARSLTSCAKIRSVRGLLYAGTERGIYVSFDDGDHWQSLQRNFR